LLNLNIYIKWDKYLQCSVIPDPKNESDLNSFISIWRDEPVCENIHEPNTDTLEKQLPDIESVNKLIKLNLIISINSN